MQRRERLVGHSKSSKGEMGHDPASRAVKLAKEAGERRSQGIGQDRGRGPVRAVSDHNVAEMKRPHEDVAGQEKRVRRQIAGTLSQEVRMNVDSLFVTETPWQPTDAAGDVLWEEYRVARVGHRGELIDTPTGY